MKAHSVLSYLFNFFCFESKIEGRLLGFQVVLFLFKKQQGKLVEFTIKFFPDFTILFMPELSFLFFKKDESFSLILLLYDDLGAL